MFVFVFQAVAVIAEIVLASVLNMVLLVPIIFWRKRA
jgi:hypothetical protein